MKEISNGQLSLQVQKGKGVVSRLWSGEESLGKTFWPYGVCLCTPALIFLAFVYKISSVLDEGLGATISILAALATWGVMVFVMVAVWRSARKSDARKMWRVLARVFAVLPLAFVLLGIALAVGVGSYSSYQGYMERAQQDAVQYQQEAGNEILSRPAPDEVPAPKISSNTLPVTEDELAEELALEAQRLSEGAPIMVSEYIRMDKVIAGPGAQITYYFTSFEEVDKVKLKELVRYNVCVTEGMKDGLRWGVAYNYTYSLAARQEGRQHLTSFSVQKHNCDALFATPTLNTTGWTQESSGKTRIGRAGETELPGTRYGRDPGGTIYRYFPPGARFDAEPANMFGLDDSVSRMPN